MRYLLIFLLFVSSPLLAESSPEHTVAQLWESLSRDPQQKPNIIKLKELLHPNAVIYGGLGVIHVKDSVIHPKFGIGEIVSITQYETGVQILKIEFEDYGLKSLVASPAKLKLID